MALSGAMGQDAHSLRALTAPAASIVLAGEASADAVQAEGPPRRFESSPTRRQGIKPNCNQCEDGQFEDVYRNKAKVGRQLHMQSAHS